MKAIVSLKTSNVSGKGNTADGWSETVQTTECSGYADGPIMMKRLANYCDNADRRSPCDIRSHAYEAFYQLEFSESE
jgi:hypothetical protein